MNVLDENVPETQRQILRSRRIRVRQIGQDIWRKGIKDDEIIPLLLQLDRPTLFTLDADFYDLKLCHHNYCLIFLDVDDEMAADYVRRLLRHRALNSKAKRMGRVVRVHPAGLTIWQIHRKQESYLEWE